MLVRSNIRPGLGVLLATFLLTTACAGDELVFPDWTIDVPEGTLLREYECVPPAERRERVVLTRDLVLREALGRAFYRPSDVATASDGRVYVLDGGNSRIVAFDAGGAPLVEFGAAGEGPGEWLRVSGFGVAGDEVIVSDVASGRLITFSLDGTHVADHKLEAPLPLRDVVRAGDALIAPVDEGLPMSLRGPPHPMVPWIVGRYTPEGSEISRLIELPGSAKAVVSAAYIGALPVPVANPIFAIARNGRVYATTAEEYQVVAIEPDGDFAWALRANCPVEPMTDERKQQVIDAYVRPQGERLANATYVWPDRYAAIENLELDGEDRLWVFPYVYRPVGVEPGPESPVPVDVYSADGELLFSGLVELPSWNAAHGEYLYRLEDDAESSERVVVRYRVVTALD